MNRLRCYIYRTCYSFSLKMHFCNELVQETWIDYKAWLKSTVLWRAWLSASIWAQLPIDQFPVVFNTPLSSTLQRAAFAVSESHTYNWSARLILVWGKEFNWCLHAFYLFDWACKHAGLGPHSQWDAQEIMALINSESTLSENKIEEPECTGRFGPACFLFFFTLHLLSWADPAHWTKNLHLLLWSLHLCVLIKRGSWLKSWVENKVLLLLLEWVRGVASACCFWEKKKSFQRNIIILEVPPTADHQELSAVSGFL